MHIDKIHKNTSLFKDKKLLARGNMKANISLVNSPIN